MCDFFRLFSHPFLNRLFYFGTARTVPFQTSDWFLNRRLDWRVFRERLRPVHHQRRVVGERNVQVPAVPANNRCGRVVRASVWNAQGGAFDSGVSFHIHIETGKEALPFPLSLNIYICPYPGTFVRVRSLYRYICSCLYIYPHLYPGNVRIGTREPLPAMLIHLPLPLPGYNPTVFQT